MQVVTPEFVKDKKVLLRYDIDVTLGEGTGGRVQVTEDFKLKAGLPTLRLCLENASKVIVVGHLGRGNSPELSAKPIQEWFEQKLGEEVAFAKSLEDAGQSTSKIVLLENIRFFHGEVESDIDFAKKLAQLGQVYVNEAFASYNSAASTTIVPTLLPRFVGLHFVREVETLSKFRDNPKKPFVAIMGGAKVVDKLPVITVLAQKADAVLVGGKLVAEIREQDLNLPRNVLVGMLNSDGLDIAPQTTEAWKGLIEKAATIIWNGPLGKFEEAKNDATEKIARMILDSKADIVFGGGDTVAALGQYGLLKEAEEKTFVSVGGGAMLEFFVKGTLPTIEVLS